MRRVPSGATELAYADTNIFIALFAGEPHVLHDRALALFRRVAEGQLALIVTAVVVAELVYVGRSVLGWSRGVTTQRLVGLMEADGLVIPERSTIVRALALFARHRRLDFADAYLAAAALDLGPAAVASFDVAIHQVEGLQGVSPASRGERA